MPDLTCLHCGGTIRETTDPNLPYVHDISGNAYCSLSTFDARTIPPTGREYVATPDIPCDGCGAEQGEPCRPFCLSSLDA